MKIKNLKKYTMWGVMALATLISAAINYEKFLSYAWVFYVMVGMYLLLKFAIAPVTKAYVVGMKAKLATRDLTIKETLTNTLYLGMPILIYWCFIEEVIFRMPLLMMYDSYSQSALPAIIISSILFGVVHWSGNKYGSSETRKHMIEAGSVNFEAASKELSEKPELKKRIIHVITATLLGFGLSYLCVSQQSMMWPIVAHLFWNFGGSVIVAAILGTISLILLGIFYILKGMALWVWKYFPFRKLPKEPVVPFKGYHDEW